MQEAKTAKFVIDDVEYSFVWRMTVKEALFIQEKAHVTPQDLWVSLDRLDPLAMAAFMWTVRKRNGEAITWEDVLKHDILSFRFLPPDEPETPDGENEPEEGGAGPTSKSGKTRKTATKSTG